MYIPRALLLYKLRNHEPMTSRDEIALVAMLSVPAMLAQLSTILMQYIDASMVGSLGAEASAAIGLVSTTIWLFGGLISAVSTGFYVQVAHLMGANDTAGARDILRQSFVSALALSLLLSAIGVCISPHLPEWLGGAPEIRRDATLYFLVFSLSIPFAQLNSLCGGMLRSTGNVHLPSVINVVMCVMDVVMNALLIFPTRDVQCLGTTLTLPGAGLGVLGAVLGTSASFVICSLLMFWLACFRSRDLDIRQEVGHFLPKTETLRKSLHIALPIGVEHAVMCGAQIASTLIVAPLGTIAIAANAFGIVIESLCYMPGFGIADAATTLVGQSVGAGRWRLARSFGRWTIALGMLCMTLLAVVMYAYSPSLMRWMTPDESVQALTVEVLRIEAFVEPMYAASIVVYGVLVGVGRTMLPSFMNLATIWIVRIPLAIALAGNMGLRGVWIAMAVELCVRGACFLISIARYRWENLRAL